MNGNIRYGIFGTLIAGTIIGQGYDSHGWSAVASVAIGLVISAIGYGNIEKGVKEVIRLHDLELAARRNGR